MGTEEAPCGLNSFWPPHRPEIGRESPVEEEEEETVVWLWFENCTLALQRVSMGSRSGSSNAELSSMPETAAIAIVSGPSRLGYPATTKHHPLGLRSRGPREISKRVRTGGCFGQSCATDRPFGANWIKLADARVTFLFQVKSDVASLVDKYFGSLYENYQLSKNCLVRQARDLLVCEYHGCLHRFENEFCTQAAKLLQRVKKSSDVYESKPMSKEGRNRRYSQRSVDASLKEKKKRKRTGKGRTGRQEEEERSKKRNMRWRQRKCKKYKEKGRWTKKMRSGKEAQRGTQERKYEGEGTSKNDNENGKSEGIILERRGFKKKKKKNFGTTKATRKGQKKKDKMERMVENNDNIQQRDEDNKKRWEFNGRIGERGAKNWEEEQGDGKRKSTDKVKNAQGKRLMEWIEENGWEVLNGNKQGHEEEEWSYIDSRKEIVIDYGIVNEEALESVEEFRIGERVEPDHLPLEISTEETNHEEMGKGRAKEGQKVTIKIGDEQELEEYRTRLEKVRFEEHDKESNSLLEDRQPDRISDVGIEIVDPLNRMELDRITYLHFWTTIFAPSTKKAVLINSNVLRSHKEEKATTSQIKNPMKNENDNETSFGT
ncbi:hypothetical protein GEV33_011527 [Tenebrio molitor]|uniref:Uncharacterized protein n=1 Tax=Tenebrio molitor TaxID=7067 RepID=A0A8J6L807_TENMO|nr:hypothetical protein GEV33_011527 [Tenebrio molitor]